MNGYLAFSLIMTVVLVPLTIKFLKGLRLDPSDPYKFAAPYGSAQLRSFTGYASDVSVSRDSKVTGATTTGHVTGSVSGSGAVYGTTSSHTRVQTKTTLHNQFFLTGADGTAHNVKLVDWDVPVGQGNLVSMVWGAPKGRDTGKYFIARNHTTGTTLYNNRPIGDLMLGGRVNQVIMVLGLLAFPLGTAQFILIAFLGRLHVRRFTQDGGDALIKTLDQRAGQIQAAQRSQLTAPQTLAPPTARSASDELGRLYALFQQGAITAEEYERAKLAALNG